MTGLGETADEIVEAGYDLRRAGVEILTVGQYLAPSDRHWPVEKFWTPDEFESLRARLLALGFLEVFAGSYVRSSYRADDTWQQTTALRRQKNAEGFGYD
jgi:lipoic acid synthetase